MVDGAMTNPGVLLGVGDSYALQADVLQTETGPKHDAVLVVEDGRVARIVPAGSYDASPHPIRLPNRAIVPGFIDAHTHLGQAFGKSFVFGEPSQIWQRIWGPLEGSLTPDLARASASWMFLEALRGGFTTIVNFAMADEERTAAVHAAAAMTGIRLVSCAGAADLADYPQPAGSKPRLTTIENAVRRAERHLAMCAGTPRISASVCCSGIQGATPELIATLASFCAHARQPVSTPRERTFSGDPRYGPAPRHASDRTPGQARRTRPPRVVAPLHPGQRP